MKGWCSCARSSSCWFLHSACLSERFWFIHSFKCSLASGLGSLLREDENYRSARCTHRYWIREADLCRTSFLHSLLAYTQRHLSQMDTSRSKSLSVSVLERDQCKTKFSKVVLYKMYEDVKGEFACWSGHEKQSSNVR